MYLVGLFIQLITTQDLCSIEFLSRLSVLLLCCIAGYHKCPMFLEGVFAHKMLLTRTSERILINELTFHTF